MTRKDPAYSLLFLSCDLTGSTNFKQQAVRSSFPWQRAFLSFYREFPQFVRKVQETLGYQELQFDLWKPVGDELIYTCKIACERDVYGAVHVWQHAMWQYQKESLVKEREIAPMGTKGGAFIATFPGPDSESTIPRQPADANDLDVVALNKKALSGRRSHTQYLFDYFGPSIDTGFRIISKCSPRYFTMTVEVALAILAHRNTARTSMECSERNTEENPHPIVLQEMASLKGVWSGREYPVFAFDLHSEDPVNKALEKLATVGDPVLDLYEICKACYQSEGWAGKLYLPGSGSPELQVQPEDPLKDYMSENREGGESIPDEASNGDKLVDNPPLG